MLRSVDDEGETDMQWAALPIKDGDFTLAQMSFEEFKRSLADDKAPAGLSLALTALWLDGHGDWEGAHEAAQAETGRDGSWVHAYLHRKEGDVGNAGYWYSRAKRSTPKQNISLPQEWTEIARELLDRKQEK